MLSNDVVKPSNYISEIIIDKEAPEVTKEVSENVVKPSNYILEIMIDKEAPGITEELLEAIFEKMREIVTLIIDPGFVTGGIREEDCDVKT